MAMKMAKPSDAQFDAVWNFLDSMERFAVKGKAPSPDWLHRNFAQIESCWQRVLFAGKTAIDNVCDPNTSTLEYKPEIAAALAAAGIIET